MSLLGSDKQSKANPIMSERLHNAQNTIAKQQDEIHRRDIEIVELKGKMNTQQITNDAIIDRLKTQKNRLEDELQSKGYFLRWSVFFALLVDYLDSFGSYVRSIFTLKEKYVGR